MRIESLDAKAYAIAATAITAERLTGGAGTTALIDAAWHLSSPGRFPAPRAFGVDPQLADLLVSTLDAGPGDIVWVPFDPSGQLTLRLARTGAAVWTTVQDSRQGTALRLLMYANGGGLRAHVRLVTPAAILDEAPKFTHCLVTPPLGARVSHDGWWGEFERVRRVRRFDPLPEELDRSEAWAIATIWPAVSKAGVFLVTPSLLFGKGQEARLRRSLLVGGSGSVVAGVFGLPNGLLSAAGVAAGILLLGDDPERNAVRMVDLAGASVDGQVRSRFGRDVDVAQAGKMMSGDGGVDQVAALVPVSEFKETDYSLMPSRYTRKLADVGGNRTPLGELVVGGAIRTPPIPRGADTISVWEVGAALLDRWQPIEGGFDKWTRIAPRRVLETGLRPADIVVSVKGSVGKVGVMGQTDSEYAQSPEAADESDEPPSSRTAVPSQACIALRPDPTKVLPEYLFAFLRSEDFKRQLEALRVGSVIAHVTPSALLTAILVPVPSLDEQAQVAARCRELMELENQVEELHARMSHMQAEIFSPR